KPAAGRELRELVEDLVAHREMQHERVVRAHRAEELAVRARLAVDAVLRLNRVRLRVVAPLAEARAQREDVIGHRVVRREDRMELVDRAHASGWNPTTA